MRRFALALFALLACTGLARADVIVDNHLSGTGDNVVFNSLSGDLATALLNGPHLDVVRFRDLTGSTTFGAAANGNDIKIVGTQNLFIQVFDPTDTSVVGTTTQVFSITGTGSVSAFVQAQLNGVDEAIQAFDLTGLFGALGPGQNGFTFHAINGEVMTSLRILDVGGQITDFEHYRIDVAPLAVPGPVVGAGLPGLLAACLGLLLFNRYRRNKRNDGFDAALA